MPNKRMRPIVKLEPGASGAQEAAWEREGLCRGGDMGEEGAGAELLRANAEALAFALQGMERERAMVEQLLQVKEELLQAKAQVAELRADATKTSKSAAAKVKGGVKKDAGKRKGCKDKAKAKAKPKRKESANGKSDV